MPPELGRTLEDTELGSVRDEFHYNVWYASGEQQIEDVRYVTGLTVYAVRIYSTKATLLS